MTPGGQAQSRLASSNFDTILVTRSDRLLPCKTVSPAVCLACHTTLRNPIVTLGMRDCTAERRGAPGPTDSGRRTQAQQQQQQQRRALTVRRGAPQAPAPGRPSSSTATNSTTASRHHFYLHSDVWATGGKAWHWAGLFPCSGLGERNRNKSGTFYLTSGSNLSLCLVQICRRYFRQNISVKGMILNNAIVEHWPQQQPIFLASCKL